MEEAAAPRLPGVYPGDRSFDILSFKRKQRRFDYFFLYTIVPVSIIIPTDWNPVSNKKERLI